MFSYFRPKIDRCCFCKGIGHKSKTCPTRRRSTQRDSLRMRLAAKLKCSACNQSFVDPVLATCCGNSFCRRCVEQEVAGRWDCPSCKQPGATVPNKALNEIVKLFAPTADIGDITAAFAGMNVTAPNEHGEDPQRRIVNDSEESGTDEIHEASNAAEAIANPEVEPTYSERPEVEQPPLTPELVNINGSPEVAANGSAASNAASSDGELNQGFHHMRESDANVTEMPPGWRPLGDNETRFSLEGTPSILSVKSSRAVDLSESFRQIHEDLEEIPIEMENRGARVTRSTQTQFDEFEKLRLVNKNLVEELLESEKRIKALERRQRRNDQIDVQLNRELESINEGLDKFRINHKEMTQKWQQLNRESQEQKIDDLLRSIERIIDESVTQVNSTLLEQTGAGSSGETR